MVSKTSLHSVKTKTPVLQLRVDLLYLKPAIWRRLIVPGSIKLPTLHVVLLNTMGWQGGHLHEFLIGEDNYGVPDPVFNDPPVLSEERVTLIRALSEFTSFIYVYDFGDNWRHRIKVEKVLPHDPDLKSPVCLAGANACPPEDVGGSHAYLDFLEIIHNPLHEEHHAMLEWCGGHFDPTAFSLDDVNDQLTHIKL